MTDSQSHTILILTTRLAAQSADMQAALLRLEDQIELMSHRLSNEIAMARERTRSDIVCWLDLLIGMVGIAVINFTMVLVIGGIGHPH